MKRYAYLFIVALIVAAPLHAQQTKSKEIVQLFRDVVAKPSQCTVRVLVGGKDAALGTVVSADGWILTKHSELRPGKLTCKLADGAECEAKLFGHDDQFDLVMLKIDAKDLTPVVWSDSKVSKIGHWVASPGTEKDPVAIGVISVAARPVKGKFIPSTGKPIGYLGLALDLNFAGVKVDEAFDGKPAHKAGLKAGDQILSVNGEPVESPDEFSGLLKRFKPNDDINLKILRSDKEMDLTVKLGTNPNDKGGKSRGDIQNNMGSKLSDRRTGFPVILQHDSVLNPTDCGGPLCNLDGQVIGVNIARAGRTESYAIPSEAVKPLLEKLKVAAKDKTPKATKLFDGKSLDGWEGDKDTWRVEDGSIVGGSLEKSVPRNEFLCTTKSFGDFELKVKFKLIGDKKDANAGVQFRTKRIPKHHEVSGYQADIGQGYWGALYDESRRNKILAGPPKEVIDKIVKHDDWNDYLIRCEGPRIRLWLNGTLTVDFTEKDEKIERTGIIGLQIHGGAKAKAYYKDIVIDELPAK